jgi:hypothetical protein
LRAARTGASGAPWTCFKISKSRGAIARVPATDSARVMPGATPSETVEGAGKTGCPLHPRPTRKNMFARARVDHRYRRNHAGLPCAMVYGLLRALPGEPACCHRRLRKGAGLLEDLAPAWARQDHTTWPSAKRAARQSALRVHRIPPRVRDDASAPLAGTGRVDHTPDSTFWKTELFSSRRLTGFWRRCPSGKSVEIFDERRLSQYGFTESHREESASCKFAMLKKSRILNCRPKGVHSGDMDAFVSRQGADDLMTLLP